MMAQAQEAAYLWGAAEALRESIGLTSSRPAGDADVASKWELVNLDQI
jgi:hypothetical protein